MHILGPHLEKTYTCFRNPRFSCVKTSDVSAISTRCTDCRRNLTLDERVPKRASTTWKAHYRSCLRLGWQCWQTPRLEPAAILILSPFIWSSSKSLMEGIVKWQANLFCTKDTCASTQNAVHLVADPLDPRPAPRSNAHRASLSLAPCPAPSSARPEQRPPRAGPGVSQ